MTQVKAASFRFCLIGLVIWTLGCDRGPEPSPVDEPTVVEPDPVDEVPENPIDVPPIRRLDDGSYIGRDGMVLIEIPAGPFWYPVNSFDLGTDEQRELPTFFIDRTEVTLAMYRDCVDAGACEPLDIEPDHQHKCTEYWPDGDANVLPVNCTSHNDAAAYCTWVGRRLPTREEWTKAYRGTDRRAFPWGDEPPYEDEVYRMNSHSGMMRGLDWGSERGEDGFEFVAPVGSFETDTSPYGVLDMGGNVSEAVFDPQPFYPASSAELNDTARFPTIGAGMHIFRDPPTRATASGRSQHGYGKGVRCVLNESPHQGESQ